MLVASTVWGAPVMEFPLEQSENVVKNVSGAKCAVSTMMLDKDCFAPGVSGNGLVSTGNGEGVMIDFTQPLVTGPATVSFYFRPDRFGHHTQMTLASFFTHPRMILAVKIVGNRLCAMDWSNYDKRLTRPFGPELKKHEWHHLAWQMTGEKWQFYLDGALVYTMQSPTTVDSAKSHRFLLANDFNHRVEMRDHFVGMLDEVKLESGLTDPSVFAEAAKKLAGAPEFKGFAYPGAKHIGANEVPPQVRIDPKTQSFIINGQSEPVMMYAGGEFDSSCDYVYETAPDAFKSGMRIFRIGTCPRDFKHDEWWFGPDQYDFESLDLQLDMLFRKEPNALLLFQIPMSPPVWWGRTYKDEETKGFGGETWRDYRASHSFSSEKWLQDTAKAYQAFFEHYRKTPYFKRTIGYVTVIGRYNEAFRWGYNGGFKQMTDYSLPEQRGFRQYLARRYGTNEKFNAARPANEAVKSFDEAQIPTPEARLKSKGYFVDPVRERNVIDYRMYLNENHADKIGIFTSMIRNLVGQDKVIGLYYGYVFSDSNGHGRTFSNESGHYGLAKVLRQKQIDFLLDSMAHFQREIGNAGPTAGAPAANALHGKLWMDEADIRTSLTNGSAEYSGARNLEESLGVLWRAFGTIQINRSGLWWFPITGHKTYSDPAIWSAFAKMYQEMRYSAAHPVKKDYANTVALIMDPQSIHFRKYGKLDPVCGNLITGLLGPIAKAGFEYDLHLVEDLEQIPDTYKTYIFLNSFHLSAAQRQLIARRFQKDGNLLVWTYGAGYFTGDDDKAYSAAAANISSLTGINVQEAAAPAVPKGTVTAGASFPAQKLSVDPKNVPLAPMFSVADPSAKAIAVFADTKSALDGQVAAAIKDHGNYRTVYLGLPVWTPELLRGLALLGKVHVYSKDAPTYVLRAGNGHILLHSANAVTANLKLPRKAARIVDVVTGNVVASDTDSVQVPVAKRNSRYLRIEE